MNKIEVKVLNPEVATNYGQIMTAMARLTQHGATVHNMDEFMELYNKPRSDALCSALDALPHPTLERFGMINVIIVGASRRFLAQITRHQDDVHFMSASLQYSDYSDQAAYAIPYGLLGDEQATNRLQYMASCESSIRSYEKLIKQGTDHDSAGFMLPQALRNVMLISATPFEWKHIISQRVCRRNSDETRIVMLKVWEQLKELNPTIFTNAGPFCMNGPCMEGKMSCGNLLDEWMSPETILEMDYPNLKEAVK